MMNEPPRSPAGASPPPPRRGVTAAETIRAWALDSAARAMSRPQIRAQDVLAAAVLFEQFIKSGSWDHGSGDPGSVR